MTPSPCSAYFQNPEFNPGFPQAVPSSLLPHSAPPIRGKCSGSLWGPYTIASITSSPPGSLTVSRTLVCFCFGKSADETNVEIHNHFPFACTNVMADSGGHPAESAISPTSRNMSRPPRTCNRAAASYGRRRAANACSICRSRNTKFDNQRPICGFCAATGGDCRYADSDPSQFDRATLAILQRLSDPESGIYGRMDQRPKECIVRKISTEA